MLYVGLNCKLLKFRFGLLVYFAIILWSKYNLYPSFLSPRVFNLVGLLWYWYLLVSCFVDCCADCELRCFDACVDTLMYVGFCWFCRFGVLMSGSCAIALWVCCFTICLNWVLWHYCIVFELWYSYCGFILGWVLNHDLGFGFGVMYSVFYLCSNGVV